MNLIQGGRIMQKLKLRWLKVDMPMLVVTFAVMLITGVAVLSRPMQELKPFDPPAKEPPIITPGRTPSDAPSDATVLFDGKDLSAWRSVKDNGDAKWKVQDGYM